jgi:spermidine/putrescine transport system permease protein
LTAPRQSRRAPWLLSAPALAYLAVFFVWPLVNLVRTSLSDKVGSPFLPELAFAWRIANYGASLDSFGPQLLRSFGYAAIATVLTAVLAYPLAYLISFRSGRYKNLLLGMVVTPFFITFLVRTLAWKTILQDSGPLVTTLDTFGLTANGRVLNTSWAVIGGLVYNFLPFMMLPIYVSLEKIDWGLIEASRDLYASSARTFQRVLLPLSLPGLFAGTLLTFIPAAGDFINQRYLGGTNQTMIGTVIHRQFIIEKDFPEAAALSVILMALILVGVLTYARLLGTEELM